MANRSCDPFFTEPGAPYTFDLDTDASKHGWGAILYLPDPTRVPDSILLAAAQRTLPPRMTLVAIRSALHHGIRLAGSFSLAEMLQCP